MIIITKLNGVETFIRIRHSPQWAGAFAKMKECMNEWMVGWMKNEWINEKIDEVQWTPMKGNIFLSKSIKIRRTFYEQQWKSMTFHDISMQTHEKFMNIYRNQSKFYET